MAKKTLPLTTEVYITACNKTLIAMLANQYGRLDSGEARAALEAVYPRVWNEEELAAEFELESVSPPYAAVVRREGGQRGTVMRLESPRFYFLFNPERVEDVEPRAAQV